MTGGMVATRRARTVLVPGIIWGFSEEYQSTISGESGDTVIMMVAIPLRLLHVVRQSRSQKNEPIL